MLRCHIIQAVFKRNVLSYFSGVLGYLFIVVFVVAGAFAAFSPQFFANNLANLDQLGRWFPFLLLFIIPAVTMSTWSDEKKMGTDELLFTLPASDLEILLGKYLAVLAVYTTALLFSTTHILVLSFIGSPDWGVLISTYIGYWAAGAALLSAGMFASVLTSSTTVAFVLGATICCIPVFIGQVAPWSDLIQGLSLTEQFRDFSIGVIPVSGVLYFLSFTVFMLYLNLVFISKRHWSADQQANMGIQYFLRAVCLAATLISVNVVATYAGSRIDLTAERLYSLSETTDTLVEKIEKDQPVTIQAYISPDVPREYVPVRKRLMGLLRQYNQLGGSSIQVRIVDVEPFSEASEEARLFGISGRQVQSERGGKTFVETIFLGAVISSPFDEVVIPFFDIGTPVEYELTRSIRTVSKEDRLTVGILTTDAQVNGGFDMASMHSMPEWRIITELKKQYEVETVAPDAPIDGEKFDVLIAVLPSSLTQPQMENFVTYVKAGNPVLIFDDPLPVSGGRGMALAPRQPKPKQGGGGMFGQQGPPPEQKADGGRATTLLNALEIFWDNGQVVWDTSGEKLHPEFGDALRPELVFISPASGTQSAFSSKSSITAGLQELLTFFPGTIMPRAGSKIKFEPLLRTSTESGLLDWGDITEPSMFGGIGVAANPLRVLDPEAHVIAAHVTSPEDNGINVVFVADADIISDQMFVIRERGFRRTAESAELKFDNVTFILNAVDVLAGDDSFLNLRKRRAKNRTLTSVEAQKSVSLEERNKEEEKATKEADEELEIAKENFSKEVTKIQNDESLDARTKTIMLRMAQDSEQRKANVAEANIEREKLERIEDIKSKTERQIRTIENRVRFWAIVIPPIPALILGITILCLRIYNENRDIATTRRHV